MMLSSGYGASSDDAYTSVSVTHNKNLAYVLKVLRIGLVNEKIGNYITSTHSFFYRMSRIQRFSIRVLIGGRLHYQLILVLSLKILLVL